MTSDSVKDMKGVAYRADMNTGEGRLLVHCCCWRRRRRKGKGFDRAGRNGKNNRPPLFLNEFRVFIQDWSALRFDETKKEKRERREPSGNGNSRRLIVELMYFYDFSGARGIQGGDQTVC